MANNEKEGLAAALEFAANQKAEIEQGKIITIDGRDYTRVNLSPVCKPMTDTMSVTTLTGLVDFLSNNINSANDILSPVFIHVQGPDTVEVQSHDFGPFKQRETYLRARPVLTAFCFDTFMPSDKFIIGLNALFTPAYDRDELLADVSYIKLDAGAKIKDDGTSQTVTLESGARLVAARKTKSRVMLAPYCTFSEIDQPVREFVFRLDEKGQPGLFLADGGAWRSKAILSIKAWLKSNLKSSGLDIPVIA